MNESKHQQLRVALYSHDTQGLGHIRRNLAIAHALSQIEPTPTTLLISGAQVGAAFTLPPGADLLSLPSVSKDAHGHYGPRTLSMPLDDLIALRSSVIKHALEQFQPDLLIVDKVANGFGNELLPALESLHAHGHTRCVLGLRDILDEPAVARREWEQSHSAELVERYYDAVWVYGDPQVYDLVREYGWEASLASKARYTGYLDRSAQDAKLNHRTQRILKRPGQRSALCMVGGGQDGVGLAQAFVSAQLPPNMQGILLTGPFMPRAERKQIQRLAQHNPQLQVREFVNDPGPLLRQADYVVSMGGYNSVCEILALHKRALIVPRTQPRQEQWIRAERLQSLGLLDVLHPDDLSPQRLSRWLATTDPAAPTTHKAIDMNGFTRLPDLASELVAREAIYA